LRSFIPVLILASTSRYRRELLQRLGLHFEVISPRVDESPTFPESPETRAQRLALAKAAAVSQQHPDAVVIGSDQVAQCQGEILDKPGNADRCRAQLECLSGSTATFHTAVAVLQGREGRRVEFIDTTTVQFRGLAPQEIERYIAIEKPFDCAGGFRSESLGISLFSRVVSEDPTALVGLPLIALAAALRGFGYVLP
jgi:septum formation protein